MTGSIEVRRGEAHEHRTMASTVAAALLYAPRDDAGWEESAPSWAESSSFGAWVGDLCVGSASQFLVDTTVPGGARLATGAVSRVGVLPTHRRRGVASGLMRRLVDDAAERRLPLMSLRASEAVIYERYGFGMAGEYIAAKIEPWRARPVHGAAPDGTVRLVPRDDLLATIAPIYDRAMHRRAGTVTRPASWWQRYFEDALKVDTTSHVVVHEDAGGTPDGYVHYDVAWDDSTPGMTGGKGEIHDLVAVSDTAELALWAYLFDVDLIRSWSADERPVDDLVRSAIADRRAYTVTAVDDEQWLRIVDVDAALAARRYAPGTDAVTIGVVDPWLPTNDDTWRIDADGAARTEAPADLETGIAALSAAYLGGTRWHALVATGRCAAPGGDAAVAAADRLFAGARLPFCGSFF